MRKHIELNEGHQRSQKQQSSTIKELKKQIDSFTQKERILNDDIKSCERKIEWLESTTSQLQQTIDEQNARITTRDALNDELQEERALLKASVDSLTEELQKAQEQCRELQTLSVELQACKSRDEANRITIESLEKCLVDVRKDAAAQRKAFNRCEDLNKTLEQAKALSNAALEVSQKELETLRQGTKRFEDINKLKEETTTLTIAALETSVISMQKELEERREEFNRCDDLNKSYQIEVGRLLKLNTGLKEECMEIKSKYQQQMDRIAELQKYKEDYEKQSVESSKKLLDIMSKFSPDHVVSDLIQEKEQMQRENDKMTEDNVANTANVRFLVNNIQLLETHVMDLTSTHKLLIEETKGLRQTITEQEDQIVELADISDRLAAFYAAEEASESSNSGTGKSVEWDHQIASVVSRNDCQSPIGESMLHEFGRSSCIP